MERILLLNLLVTDKESTGIGLSIVKKIIEEKFGSTYIESDGNHGTNFIFTIPKNQKTVLS